MSGTRPPWQVLEAFIQATNAADAVIDRQGRILLSTPAFDQLLPQASLSSAHKAHRQFKDTISRRLGAFELWPLEAMPDAQGITQQLMGDASLLMKARLSNSAPGNVAAVHPAGIRLSLRWHFLAPQYARVELHDETSAILQQQQQHRARVKVSEALTPALGPDRSSHLAHDLRNTLTAANGLLGHLVEDFSEFLAQRAADTSTGAGVDPANLIGTISRIGTALEFAADSLSASNGIERAVGGIDAGELIEKITAIARSVVPPNVAFSVLLPDSGPLLRDHGLQSTLFLRAILNLAQNAFHAVDGRDAGAVELSAGVVAGDSPFENLPAPDRVIGEPRAGTSYLRFIIRDNGSGVRPAMLPNLFRAGHSTRAPGLGSGIGLASVAQLANQVGGFVAVSARGQFPWPGASFSIAFPIERRQPRGLEPDLPVMIVDDDPAVAESHAFWVRRAGAKPILCEPDKAEGILSELQPALMIVDRHFSSHSDDGGLRLAQIARRQRPNMPIILITGDPPETTPPFCDLVLVKPIARRLMEIVKSQLGSRL